MWLAALGRVFWLDVRADEGSLEALEPRIAALRQLASDLDGRLTHAGLGGIAGAVAVYQQLRGVLDGISLEELRRMAEQVAHLQRELGAIARRLAAFRELKAELDRLDPQLDPQG